MGWVYGVDQRWSRLWTVHSHSHSHNQFTITVHSHNHMTTLWSSTLTDLCSCHGGHDGEVVGRGVLQRERGEARGGEERKGEGRKGEENTIKKTVQRVECKPSHLASALIFKEDLQFCLEVSHTWQLLGREGGGNEQLRWNHSC